MRIKILSVEKETVNTGKKPYGKAEVVYQYNGQARTQKVMSFSNPKVYADLDKYIGQECDVEITKNDGGYNQFASLGPVGSAPDVGQSSGPPSAAPGRTNNSTVPATRSTYETPEERAARQVLIVRQSSLSSAIAFLKDKPDEDVLEVAQEFADWIFQTKEDKSGFDTLESDLPY